MDLDDREVLVGRTAHVSTAIPGGDKAGEVVVRVRGGSEAYIAFADQPIKAGAQVVVVDDRGARTLVVTPL
jgi:membrane protein implicated in regulation of membrane protease activity